MFRPDPSGSGGWSIVACLSVSAIAFVVDLMLPLGIAGGLPHVVTVLVASRCRPALAPFAAAAVGTAMTLLGAALSAPGAAPQIWITNRLLTVGILWVVAALAYQQRRAHHRFASETRAAGDALQSSIRQLKDIRHAIDQSAIVAMTDQRGIIHYVNDKFCEISKYSREELLGQDHRIVNSGYHPKAFIRELWRTIAQGRIWRGEIRNRAKDGTHYWVDTTIVPFLDGDGKPYQYLAIRSDITDRKLAEEELRRQEALAQVGRLAAVVAHEVKNPLAGIAGAIDVIGSRLPDDSPDREVIGHIMERIDALDGRVRDLLRYARPRPIEPAPVELRNLLEASADLVCRDKRFPDLRIEVEGPTLRLTADASQLHELFANLLLNAAHAMDGAGTVRVRLGRRDDRIEVELIDQGPGVPPEIRDRMFEPFATTKSQGTGLGLAIARRVAEAHAGSLDLVSSSPRGSVFRVTLPLEPEAVAAGGGAGAVVDRS